ncbi:RsmB/NOP family class I SAM-dependent RNA methyltransferase [Candidatus Pacearchaeota archaeon]|nr:RsmB/NOP family class I SAM-dependent RNA methyltransferase [Candidatus Pacearchaeota archaeon]
MARPVMKPVFEERMRELLPDKEDFEKYNEIIHKKPLNYIRCNTLKISCDELFNRLKKKWNVVQLFPDYPEIILIDQELGPGELGNAIEHLLGYYYVQEVCSMMSVLALDPKPGERVLDVCASPGSKTTQIASKMQNSGTLIANDIKLDRIRILAANLERCGVMNCVVTRNDGVGLCVRLAETGFKFDKVLLDAPCSGEGTLRSSAKTFLMWNPKVIKKISREQKKLLANAFKCLKIGGSLVYSTCTHAPEENEEVVDFALKNFPVRLEKLNLPLICRPGVTSWKSNEFSKDVSKCCRIYPQDNNSEGFFVSKFTLLDEISPFIPQNFKNGKY